MAEGFENLDNILRDWQKYKVQISFAETLNRLEKHGEPFLLENDLENILSSFSQHSNVTNYKPSTKLVLVSQEPLLYLEFNKPNRQNVSEINSF